MDPAALNPRSAALAMRNSYLFLHKICFWHDLFDVNTNRWFDSTVPSFPPSTSVLTLNPKVNVLQIHKYHHGKNPYFYKALPN